MTELEGRVTIAGGSGFLGVSLAHALAAAGAEVTILSRRPPRPSGPWRHVAWEPRPCGRARWWNAVEGASALVNLAGRTVDCVKTPDHCDEILRSRVESTAALGEAVRAASAPPRVWVQMSTAHIYGDPPEAVCDESSALGYGLAPTVGRAWEEAFSHAKPASMRGVILRTSFVIGRDRGAGGGAMTTLGLLARAGLGGTVGSGRQGMSWIHEDDLNRLIIRASRETSMSGVYIASAPHPVPQREFMRQVRARAGGLGGLGIALPAFAWMVRIGAPLVFRTDPELALYGRFVVSRRLVGEGFEFLHPDLPSALAALYGRTD